MLKLVFLGNEIIGNSFISNTRLKLGKKKRKKKKSKAKAKQHPEVNFCYLKIIQFLHPRFHTKIDILKNVQK